MATPVSYYGETWNDNTLRPNGIPESASIEFAITTLTAANLVAQTALLDTLRTALNAVSIGQPSTHSEVVFRGTPDPTPASSTLAQRENKLLIRYHNALNNRKFRASVPCFDLTLLDSGSELLDLTAGPGLALKNAIEAVVVAPDNSSASVVVDSAQFVGRNT